MCQSDQNTAVWVPTLQDNVCNLMDEGSEDMLRYSITSGELQRLLAKHHQHRTAYGDGWPVLWRRRYPRWVGWKVGYVIWLASFPGLEKEAKMAANYR